ncbi:MAG: LON peptidase substrate-binding domain-containing protein [Candidatus Limnocylindria bacterium]|nr:LON peptidase substrate-binding domain-containing protein [Candidatus Limnocylindria bacterium]
MTERLPLFPLDLVLFPGMFLPLHIFEPRYRLLMRRCSERESPFGVVIIRAGTEAGVPAQPHRVGTAAAIVAVNALPDGRSFVVARGDRRFAIERVIDDEEPYLVGEVSWIEETDGPDAGSAAAAAREAYGEYLLAVSAATAEDGAEPTAEPAATLSPGELSFRIAADLPIPNADRQRLLESPTAAARITAELHALQRETALLRDLLVRLRAHGGGSPLN